MTLKAEVTGIGESVRSGVPLMVTSALGFVVLLMANIAGAGDFRWRYALYFAMVFLLAAIALYLYLQGKKPSLDRGFLVTLAVFAGLVVLGSLSLTWANSLYEGIRGLLLPGSFFLAFILGFLLLRRWDELWLFMGLVTAASVSLCIYGLLQYFFFFNDIIEFMGSHGLDYVISNRVNSRFTSPNWFASFLIIAIPITVALLLLEKRKALSWAWGGALTLQLTCLYLTQSRGGWAVFLAVAVALAVLIPGKAWKQGLKVLAAALLLAVLLSFLSSTFDPLDTSGGTDAYGETKPGGWDYSGIDASSAAASLSSRFSIFKTGLDMFSHNLAGGVGTGNYTLAVQRYQYQSYYAAHAGNYLLEVGCEGGVIALVLIMALSLLVLFRIRAVRRLGSDGRMRVAGVALWASAVGFLAHNLLDTSWFNPLAGVLCWLCAGAMFAVSTTRRAGEEEAPAAMPAEEEGLTEPEVKAAPAKRNGVMTACLITAAVAVVVVSGYFLAVFFFAATGKEAGDYQNRYGDTAIAIDDYNNSLGFYEANPEVHRILGGIYLNLFLRSDKTFNDESAALAMQHLDRSIQLEPDNAISYLSRGLLLLNLEQGDAGRASLEEAQRLYPNNPTAFFYEAESYMAEEKYMTALEKYYETLDLFPYYANQSIAPFQERPEDKYFLMSIQRVVEILMLKGEADKALQTVDGYLLDLPDSTWLHYLRATVLEQMEKWELSLSELETVLALEPDARTIYLSMGRIYKKMGNLQKAAEMFRAELSIDPANQQAQEELRSITEGAQPGSD